MNDVGCIKIQNSDVYFIIRNCKVKNTGGDQGTGILMREFKPEKIILFGSFAKEELKEANGFTTMDVLVIAETELPFFQILL